MQEKIVFTKAALTRLDPKEGGGRTYVYDEKVNGLCLSITKAGTKSFMVYRKFNGRPVRVTLGRFPDMTIEQARKAAIKAISKMADGINPIEEKRRRKNADISLEEVLED